MDDSEADPPHAAVVDFRSHGLDAGEIVGVDELRIVPADDLIRCPGEHVGDRRRDPLDDSVGRQNCHLGRVIGQHPKSSLSLGEALRRERAFRHIARDRHEAVTQLGGAHLPGPDDVALLEPRHLQDQPLTGQHDVPVGLEQTELEVRRKELQHVRSDQLCLRYADVRQRRAVDVLVAQVHDLARLVTHAGHDQQRIAQRLHGGSKATFPVDLRPVGIHLAALYIGEWRDLVGSHSTASSPGSATPAGSSRSAPSSSRLIGNTAAGSTGRRQLRRADLRELLPPWHQPMVPPAASHRLTTPPASAGE